MGKPAEGITQLISQYRGGDKEAFDRLVTLVYDQLRRIAHNQMKRQGPAHTRAPTALLHEAFVRLAEKDGMVVKDRAHFFAVAAQCMRWILVDYAKAKKREKRGGAPVKVSFDENIH